MLLREKLLNQGHDGIVLGGLRYFLFDDWLDEEFVVVVNGDDEENEDDDDEKLLPLGLITNAGVSIDEHVDIEDDDEMSEDADEVESISWWRNFVWWLTRYKCRKKWCNSTRSCNCIDLISTVLVGTLSGIGIHSSEILGGK